MRTLCDNCEGAAAVLFCAADEAALCRACDDKVHMCNKLASRHVRVGLASPSNVPRCDICENAPAFFYCGVDGSSLCLQCDVNVHVGGKRTHRRYLLSRQLVEFPGDKSPEALNPAAEDSKNMGNGLKLNDKAKNIISYEDNDNDELDANNSDCHPKIEKNTNLIDLNTNPPRLLHQPPPNDKHKMED